MAQARDRRKRSAGAARGTAAKLSTPIRSRRPMTTPSHAIPGNTRRPTLKDIAKESGYHITTISLALRNHSSIPETTRQRIRKIAERMGYEKNPVYHALSRFRQQGTVCAPAPRIAYLENFGLGAGVVRPPHLQAILDGARR